MHKPYCSVRATYDNIGSADKVSRNGILALLQQQVEALTQLSNDTMTSLQRLLETLRRDWHSLGIFSRSSMADSGCTQLSDISRVGLGVLIAQFLDQWDEQRTTESVQSIRHSFVFPPDRRKTRNVVGDTRPHKIYINMLVLVWQTLV